ncbi:MAG: hypothetical protein HY324_02040, partial [Chlamydiia bacterium]|nr:hypothetical protein [Chlamydiia bacterium]
EIEFLQEIQDQVVPIEVKSGSITKAKSLKVFSEKYHPPHQIILSGRPIEIHGTLRKYPLYLTSLLLSRNDSPFAFY